MTRSLSHVFRVLQLSSSSGLSCDPSTTQLEAAEHQVLMGCCHAAKQEKQEKRRGLTTPLIDRVGRC